MAVLFTFYSAEAHKPLPLPGVIWKEVKAGMRFDQGVRQNVFMKQ